MKPKKKSRPKRRNVKNHNIRPERSSYICMGLGLSSVQTTLTVIFKFDIFHGMQIKNGAKFMKLQCFKAFADQSLIYRDGYFSSCWPIYPSHSYSDLCSDQLHSNFGAEMLKMTPFSSSWQGIIYAVLACSWLLILMISVDFKFISFITLEPV